MGTTWFRTKPEYGNSVDKVDRENNIIYGVSITTKGEAKGHGVFLDDEFIDETIKQGNSWKTGLKSRFGHPSMSTEALGTAVGRFKNFRRIGDKAIADFHAYKDVKGANDKIEYIMDLAEEDPKVFATSIVFNAGAIYYKDKDGKRVFPDNRGEYPDDTDYTKEFIEMKKLLATDFVDDPAANPDGLYSTNDLAAQAYKFLEDNPKLYQLLQEKPDKLFEYIKKYTEIKLSNDKGDINMDDFSKLNADYEQLRLEFKFKSEENLGLSADIEKLKAEILKLKNDSRDEIVAEALNEVPEIKHEEVKAKLLKFSDKYDSMAEFKEFAIAFAKSQDTRVKSPEVPADLNFKTIQEKQPVTVATFAEEQAELMKKYLQRGE